MKNRNWYWIAAGALAMIIATSWLVICQQDMPFHYEYSADDAQAQYVAPAADTLATTTAATVIAGVSAPAWVSNAAWDIATVAACWRQFGPVDLGSYTEREAIEKLTNFASSAGLSPPRNGEELLMALYDVTPTNEKDGLMFGILRCVTNETYTDLLLWGYTNFYYDARRIVDMQDLYRDIAMTKSHCSLNSLRNMGTPTVIDRVNKMQRLMCDAGDDLSMPGETIDPAQYPVDAREWLLNYPEPDVRYNMVHEWLHSGRPETPELLNEWCRRINSMPDDFHLWAGDPNVPASKRKIVRYVKDLRVRYIRRYQRWQADGQKDCFNSGRYRDP